MARKIVLLEANEVPNRILDGFIHRNPESALARVVPRCRRYDTVAADTCALSPWITWPTLHRGVPNDRHHIMHFGQDLSVPDKEYPPIWRLLLDAGLDVGVFGPLHSSPIPEDVDRFAFYLPDTFAHTSNAHPKGLESFQRFNLEMARRSARNVSRAIDFSSLLQFMSKAPILGLRPRTLAAIARQLVDERRQPWKSTRRRTYQPVVAFDLFMKQLSRHRPDFCNFFTNHVASAMHRYWAALHPEDYDVLELDEEWQARFRGEVDFAMGWLDRFVARLVDLAERDDDHVIIIASSMGQQAAHGERLDCQLYLRRPELLLRRAGIGDHEWERRPAMDPTVSLFVSSGKSEELKSLLSSMTIGGDPVKFKAEEGGFFDIAFGHPNLDPDVDKLVIGGEELPYDAIGLENVVVEDEAGSTGYHQPEGILLVYDPRTPGPGDRDTVSTTDVAPAILRHFGVRVPDYMSGSTRFMLPS